MNELLNEDQRERRGRHVVDLICSSRGMASIRLVAALLVASPLAAASAVASSGAPACSLSVHTHSSLPTRDLGGVRAALGLPSTLTMSRAALLRSAAAASRSSSRRCLGRRLRSMWRRATRSPT